MATVYYMNQELQKNVDPVPGAMYWWYQHPRSLLTLTVLEVDGDNIRLRWENYMVPAGMTAATGKVVWNRQEWDAAELKEYRKPINKEDLGPDEALCRSCEGCYFEMGGDLEIFVCIWCDRGRPGRMKKSLPSPPLPRRSPFHPPVPAQNVKDEV